MKYFSTFFFLCTFSFLTAAGELENARKAKSKKIIKCSPDGKNGGVAPVVAMANLTKGATLELLPGHYASKITVNPDKVIITSDASRRCDVDLEVKGKGCIIKNLWCSQVGASDSIIIVDSMLDSFQSDNNKKSLNHSIYNSCLGHLSVTSGKTKIKLQNCTLISSTKTILSSALSKLTFDKCILFSKYRVFLFLNYQKKKPTVSLRNSLCFGETGIAESGAGERKQIPIHTIKDLKKVTRLTLLGKNISKSPVFVKPLKEDKKNCIPNMVFSVIHFVEPDNFRLKPDSPGQDMGVITAENPFFKDSVNTEKVFPKQ